MSYSSEKVSIELCAKCLMSWQFKEMSGKINENNEEIFNDFPLADILRRKIEWAGLDIKVPDELYLILAICSNSPGYIQLLMKELLESIPNLTQGYQIKAIDFVTKYPDSFPISDSKRWEEHFNKLWDDQKVRVTDKRYNTFSDNNCDSKEWWQEVLK